MKEKQLSNHISPEKKHVTYFRHKMPIMQDQNGKRPCHIFHWQKLEMRYHNIEEWYISIMHWCTCSISALAAKDIVCIEKKWYDKKWIRLLYIRIHTRCQLNQFNTNSEAAKLSRVSQNKGIIKFWGLCCFCCCTRSNLKWMMDLRSSFQTSPNWPRWKMFFFQGPF